MAETTLAQQVLKAAKARGISIEAGALPAVLKGAEWLRSCVALLAAPDLTR
ncbi:MAG: hypothetical protein IPK28_09970 [Devosia sp.]|nr:hypothetical protein [Devosia sp.]